MSNMKSRRTEQASAKQTFAFHILWVTCFSLVSLAQCQNVFEYFNNPRINFGDFFYASFPNGSVHKLYECLCDMNITHCSLTYELEDGLNNQFGFPYYYTVTDLSQDRLPPGQASDKVYTRSVLCDTLNHSPKDNLNCRRLPVGDTTCRTRQFGCLEYSVEQDDAKCAFDCGMLLWLADFAMEIEYTNFGSLPVPQKNGVCPGSTESTITNSTELTTDVVYSNTSIDFVNSTTYPHTNNTASGGERRGNATQETPLQQQNEERTDTSENDFWSGLVFLWVAIGCSVLVVGAATVFCVCIRTREKGKLNTPPSSQSSPAYSSDGSHQDSTPPETSETSSEGMDAARYYTLDEMAVGFDTETDFAQCDSQGYNTIRDKDLSILPDGPPRDESRVCRPLPHLPNIEDVKLHSENSSQATPSSGTWNSPPSSTLSTTDNFVSTDPPSSNDVKPLGDPINVLPMSLEQLSPTTDTSNIMPPPRPHKPLVDLDYHTYLGLVNLKSDQDLFGHVTEVKLVRTPQGHLELVDVNEELPAFTNYYTRILLLDQDVNIVGVVGFLEDTSETENDFSANEPLSQRDISLTPSYTSGAESAKLDGTDSPFPKVIYFGSMEIDEDMSFQPCDYLTVLDTERGTEQPESGGYLTVLDVESDG